MKVLKEFYCIETKEVYKEGQEYKGNRKDINHLLDVPNEVKAPKKNK
jgi:hypothetical protein